MKQNDAQKDSKIQGSNHSDVAIQGPKITSLLHIEQVVDICGGRFTERAQQTSAVCKPT